MGERKRFLDFIRLETMESVTEPFLMGNSVKETVNGLGKAEFLASMNPWPMGSFLICMPCSW